MGHEREPLHLLIVGEWLLEGLDAIPYHRVYLVVGTEVLSTLEGDVVLSGIILQKAVFGYDECRHEFALVGDDGNLVDILIHEQQRLNHLRGDIFAVGCLE